MKFFFLLLLPVNIYCQELEKIIDNNNPFTEIYYVLKSDKSVMHGSYKKFANRNILLTEGFYKNGRKDSLWTEFWNLKTKKMSGNYKYSRKVGEWEFYNFSGELDQKYNFTTNKITYFKTDDIEKNKEYKVILDSSTILSKVERPPLVIGGFVSLHESISNKIEYPFEARRRGIMGKVFISFIIDEIGNRSEFKIEKGIGAGCDEEALRVVTEMDNKWIPAILNGEKVKVIYIIPISFTLN